MADETVNLYWVREYDESYGYFVFASTANKARSLCVYRNSDNEEYINLRAYLKAKNVGGKNNVVVEAEFDKDYDRVLATGNGFRSEDGDDA